MGTPALRKKKKRNHFLDPCIPSKTVEKGRTATQSQLKRLPHPGRKRSEVKPLSFSKKTMGFFRRDLFMTVFLVAVVLSWYSSWGYRTFYDGLLRPSNQTYFRPYDPGFVGRYGDPANYQRERTNEGSFDNPTQELLFGDLNGAQVCPGMVGPFSDGSFYCTAKEFGYCDQRSGTCFCNTGYQGVDCTQCQPTHYMMGTLCYPKMLCPNDCSNMGKCNYNNGTCTCLPFRTGDACDHMLCTNFHPMCQSCNQHKCLGCKASYYLLTNHTCNSCSDFDPRCSACSLALGCTNCSDPLLTSIRRSGYREIDPLLPFEENTRQISIGDLLLSIHT